MYDWYPFSDRPDSGESAGMLLENLLRNLLECFCSGSEERRDGLQRDLPRSAVSHRGLQSVSLKEESPPG